MNTSKSLNEILRTLYDIGRHEEAGGLTDRKAAFSEAKQAIVEAVEGLKPKKSKSQGLPAGHVSVYDSGYNKGVADFLQAIKEWQ